MRKIIVILNKLLDSVSFLNKTRLILCVLVAGMVSICFFTFISLFALKYDHETLYESRVTRIANLEKIKTIYVGKETSEEAWSQIGEAWNSYKSDVTPKFPANFAHWWLNLFIAYEKPVFSENSIESIENEIEARLKENDARKTTNLLNALIKRHFEETKNEKQIADSVFNRGVSILSLLILCVFIVSSFATYFILSNIRKLHNYLEFDVKKKTNELEALNNSLEERIKEEVEISRNKDRILFQQSKLASLGEMLQNIAHQWRQPLGAISMIIQSFEIKHKSGKLTNEFISSGAADAKLLAQNMSETLDDFRTFFNPNKSKKEFSLKDVINKSVDLSRYLLEKESIELSQSEFADVELYGFKNELTHVLLNLINNAKDALSSKNITKKVEISVEFDKENTIIKVTDNGGGIDEEIMYRVFDPYFTTKHKSMGTGIGLYMSKQIVEEHMAGHIYCRNIEKEIDGALYRCAMFVVEIPLGKSEEEADDEQTKL